MKTLRLTLLAAVCCLVTAASAQGQLTENAKKAQTSLMDYLKKSNNSPTIDTRDNSVCFKYQNVLYWVTFQDSDPISYVVHRKGIKFDNNFKLVCAQAAVNEVNRKHRVKCVLAEKNVNFTMQVYAKSPSEFNGVLRRMLDDFKDVDVTLKNTYDKAYEKWRKDSTEAHTPILLDTPLAGSALKVSYVAFGNFDARGNILSDYNQPLRKNSCRYIKARVTLTSQEKGIFKLGMKIISPDGKAMTTTKGFEYSSTSNVEVKKVNKEMECQLDPYGSDTQNFWKAGEYKVEIYDFERGALLYATTFNIL